jgi:pilus assembly protein Flp/PilA
MFKKLATLKNFLKDEEGASLVEYALLVALIALACVIAITATGVSISAMFTRINNKLSTVAT